MKAREKIYLLLNNQKSI